MFGLGKNLTPLGKWMHKRGITQTWLKKKTGLNKNTITDLATNTERSHTQRTLKKVLNALREIDPNVKSDDFWNM